MFEVGTSYDCWKPTIPGPFSDFYNCGNDDCMKLIDPQKEVDSAEGAATGLKIAGIVCLSLGIPFFLIGIGVVFCACKMRQ
mmetsp:Transcript_4539/g.7323  ORF Transcript_4539/g.7323 Transcript_4539/m.7323 type:complete len:81 (-) Transcript_4539:240-482(-)